MAWTKHTRTYRRPPARAARTVPAVSRGPSNPRGAALVLPESMATAERADVYVNGGDKIAFRLHDRGERSVIRANKASRAHKIAIPAEFAARIPYGTTDVALTNDGGMLVLDLTQLDGRA